MSEKLFALLFRLYPARFRAAWQQDALDLIRERTQDERGFVPRLRLCYDLLADFATSLPRAYMIDHAGLAPAAPAQGAPSFILLEEKPIRSSAFFFGTVFSIVALLGLSVLSRHAGHFPIRHADEAAEANGMTADPWATGHGSGNGSAMAIGPDATPAAARAGTVAPADIVHVNAPAPPQPFFDAAEKHRVLLGVAQELKQHYPDQAMATQLGKQLLGSESTIAGTGDPGTFAAAITQKLRADSRDMHFEVVFSEQSAAVRSAPAIIDAQYSAAMREANCMMQQPAMLPHNIAYLKLDWFPEPEVCGTAVIAALKQVGSANALILDLRDNTGGSPAMVMFIAGWLFDRPAFLYNPRESEPGKMWTSSPMAGSRLASKPVYILTSSRTYSAAEHFSYDLKELHRATLVGETTAGATDVGVYHRIDEHFGIGLRESRVANPYPEPDWAVNGVRPDVQVPASGALATAESLAAQRLAGK